MDASSGTFKWASNNSPLTNITIDPTTQGDCLFKNPYNDITAGDYYAKRGLCSKTQSFQACWTC